MWANALRASALGVPSDSAAAAQLVEHHVVVGRVDDDADVRVVLGRGPDHGRPADVVIVDELDRRVGPERVEVHDDEVDRLDAVLRHVGLVVGVDGRRGSRRAPSGAA